jgi:hypothetical protein
MYVKKEKSRRAKNMNTFLFLQCFWKQSFFVTLFKSHELFEIDKAPFV